jgi:hypothetical protein
MPEREPTKLQQLRRLRGRLATPKPKAAAAPPATAAFATGLGGLVAGLAGQALLQPAGRGRGRERGGALTTAVAQPIAPPGLKGGPGSESLTPHMLCPQLVCPQQLLLLKPSMPRKDKKEQRWSKRKAGSLKERKAKRTSKRSGKSRKNATSSSDSYSSQDSSPERKSPSRTTQRKKSKRPRHEESVGWVNNETDRSSSNATYLHRGNDDWVASPYQSVAAPIEKAPSCYHCGVTYREDAMFCRDCGRKKWLGAMRCS